MQPKLGGTPSAADCSVASMGDDRERRVHARGRKCAAAHILFSRPCRRSLLIVTQLPRLERCFVTRDGVAPKTFNRRSSFFHLDALTLGIAIFPIGRAE
jgi:hypothetical protein